MIPPEKNSSKCLGLPRWIAGYLLGAFISCGSFYALGIAANYTTMHYVNEGYDPRTGEWNPRAPLDDALLPSLEWLDNHLDWLMSKPGGVDYTFLRDLPFGIMITVGLLLPLLFGRMDVFWNTTLIQMFLIGFKVYTGFTWQTPTAQGKRLAVYEIGGDAEVLAWRQASHGGRTYWRNLFGSSTNHAGDMVYSGHTFNALNLTRAGLWVLSEAKIPKRKCVFWTYTWVSLILFLTGMIIMMLTRGHYSFDVVLAFVLWYLLTQCIWLRQVSKSISKFFTREGTLLPPSVESFLQRPGTRHLESIAVCKHQNGSMSSVT